MKRIIMSLALLGLVACSSAPKLKKLNEIQVGATKNQVLKALGDPASTEHEDSLEYLNYTMIDDDGEKRPRLIVLKDNEVLYSGKPSGFDRPKPKHDDKPGQAVNVSVNPVNNINITGGALSSPQAEPQPYNTYSRALPSVATTPEEVALVEKSRLDMLQRQAPDLVHGCRSAPITDSWGRVVRYDTQCW